MLKKTFILIHDSRKTCACPSLTGLGFPCIRNYSRNFTKLIPPHILGAVCNFARPVEILMSKNRVLVALVVWNLLVCSSAQVQTVQPAAQAPVTSSAPTGPTLEDGTPGQITQCPPSQTLCPMFTGFAPSSPLRRTSASTGWKAV